MNLFSDPSLSPLSVGDYVISAKQQLEAHFKRTWIFGEISNFSCAASGHWYFSLRDDRAQIDCVMFSKESKTVNFLPQNGEQIIIFGYPTIYPMRGRFQFQVLFLRIGEGENSLYKIFLQRKKQWFLRGWFDNKKNLPLFPQSVGLVCSLTGAALKDMLRVLTARPLSRILIYPAPAQGIDAADKISTAINQASQRKEVEILLVCRGGGSFEDLWAYNEEVVVEAIVNSSIPIITGIGHQIDETLADFAATHSASTPTAAAIAVGESRTEWTNHLQSYHQRLKLPLEDKLNEKIQALDWIEKFLTFSHDWFNFKTQLLKHQHSTLTLSLERQFNQLHQQLEKKSHQLQPANINLLFQKLENQQQKLNSLLGLAFSRLKTQLEHRHQKLQLLSPEHLLSRGYSIVSDANNNDIIREAKCLTIGKAVNITFHRGRAHAIIKKCKP